MSVYILHHYITSFLVGMLCFTIHSFFPEAVMSIRSWWRHQMETFFRVTGPLCGEFTGDRWFPLTKASNAGGALTFLLIWALINWLSKHSWGWWFVLPSRSLWRRCNVLTPNSHRINVPKDKQDLAKLYIITKEPHDIQQPVSPCSCHMILPYFTWQNIL